MVDPNPARGMPLQFQKYWIAGKGGIKIRWNVPGDFKRCVRNLRKYFPKNPEGLCNILHTKATGGPPGHGSAEKGLHALHASMVGHYNLEALTAAQELMDAQPALGQYTWAGPLAPVGRPTAEPRRSRVFEPGSLYHRVLPLPLDWREHQGPGHTGAVTVGRILGLTYGPDHQGQEYAWGWGDFLDESIIPAAMKARYLAEQGVVGTSLDPGGPITAGVNPDTGMEHMIKFGIGGATLVPIEAFTMMRIHVFQDDGDWPDDDPDMQALLDGEDCGCDGAAPPQPSQALSIGASDTYAVNTSGWRGLPLAPREAVFDNDNAVLRIAAWANGDAAKMQKAFMWHSDQGNPLDPTSYRLPLGDIINGELTIVFHAIYAAAALMSGAHGGLPDVSPQDDAKIRSTISEIYAEMAKAFGDTSVRAPWDRSAQEGVQLSMDQFAAVDKPYGDVKYADPGYRDGKARYPLDSEEHCRAAWSYINQADNAKFYNAAQLKAIKSRILAAGKKYGIQFNDSEGGAEDAGESKSKDSGQYSITGVPITPPKAWFEDPKLPRKTKLTVTPEGRVYGHLAAWNECHRDVAMRECVMAPKSQLGYAPFHLGTTLTAEGELIDTGKIVMDTRHANINLGYAATAIHYDNTGDEIATIRCGEDEFGIWFAGAVVPEATPTKIAKLRRSPLSGDWRRERGSLELTAALAVNAPAFPVYAMEDNERLALVAAGSVWEDDGEYILVSDVPTGIVNALTTAVQDAFAAQEAQAEESELAERLRDLLEDDEIYARRQRQERLMKVFATDQTGVLQR